MVDEFCVELCVVGGLDGTGSWQQLAQRFHLRGGLQVYIRKTIEVDDVDAIGRGQLNQTQAAEIRVKLSRLSVEADGVFVEEFIDSAPQFFGRGYELVLRVHR